MRKSETPIKAALRLKTMVLPSGLEAVVYPGGGTVGMQFVGDIREQLGVDMMKFKDGTQAEQVSGLSAMARMNRLVHAAVFGFSVKALNLDGESFVFETPRVTPSGATPAEVLTYAHAIVAELESGLGAEVVDFGDVEWLATKALRKDASDEIEAEKKAS